MLLQPVSRTELLEDNTFMQTVAYILEQHGMNKDSYLEAVHRHNEAYFNNIVDKEMAGEAGLIDANVDIVAGHFDADMSQEEILAACYGQYSDSEYWQRPLPILTHITEAESINDQEYLYTLHVIAV